jgi:hypothetical protein
MGQPRNTGLAIAGVTCALGPFVSLGAGAVYASTHWLPAGYFEIGAVTVTTVALAAFFWLLRKA